MDDTSTDEAIAQRGRVLWMHFLVFTAVSLVLFALDIIFSDVRWFYWPVMAWGAILGAHALYCKSLAVDDDWVERRTNRVHDKSYDISHIRDIENSFVESQSAEKSAAERKD